MHKEITHFNEAGVHRSTHKLLSKSEQDPRKAYFVMLSHGCSQTDSPVEKLK
jgi:hypothetical protein